MKWRRRFGVVAVGMSGSAISQRSVISEHRSERDAREAASLERRRLEVIRADEAASWSILVVRGDEVLHEERPFDGRREDVPVPPLADLHIRQADEPPAGPAPDAAEEAADPTPTASLPAMPGAADDAPPADADADADAGADAAPAGGADPADARGGEEAPPASAPSPAPDAGGAAEPPTGVAPAAVPEFDEAPEFEAAPGADAGSPEDSGATGRVPRPRRDPAPRRDAEAPPSGPVPEEIIRRFEESIARERARKARR